MDAVDLDDAAAELYALTPAEFTARRAELAAQARKDGQKDLAKEISELRRPTVSAWLVNQLARGAGGAGEEIEDLEQLGKDLRAAQEQLDGQRMKELAKHRHELVASLVRRAEAVATEGEQKVSAGAQRELEETFGAAVADEQASLAVTSGRLTRALVYAGFGDVDVSAATATPLSAKRRQLGSAPKKRAAKASPATGDDSATDSSAQAATDRARAAREQATEALDIARADEAAAVDEFEAADRHRDELRAQETRLTVTLDELQREIVRVRHELDDLTRSLGSADREYQRRQRQVDQARRAVQQADQALQQLTDSD
jgi:hypothetical protein